MLATMDAQEVEDWRHYYALEPFGHDRQDLQAGHIVACMLNMFRDKEKPPLVAAEVIPGWGKMLADLQAAQTEAVDPKEIWRAYALAHGSVNDDPE